MPKLLAFLKVYLKSATKPFNVLIACTRPFITELADKLRMPPPLLPTISPYWRKRSIPTHSEWLYPLTFDAGKGLKEA